MNSPRQNRSKTLNSSEAPKQHSTSVNNLECRTCGKAFPTKHARQQHMNDTHSKTNSNKNDNSKRSKPPSGDWQVVKQRLGASGHAPVYISNTYNHLVHSVQSVPEHTAGAHARTGASSSKVAPKTTMPKRPNEIKVGPRRKPSPEKEREKDKLQNQDKRITRRRSL